ncbi:MAG: hypothetical protein IPL92_13070 [Saprospiraceae bacterium]|nr:hypothetical protein [Candidatus Opimibacter iunctus]
MITIEVVSEINIAPEILQLTATSRYTSPDGTISLHAIVTDQNNDEITYSWTATQGQIIGSDDLADWLAPAEEGISTIQLMVTDGAWRICSKYQANRAGSGFAYRW